MSIDIQFFFENVTWHFGFGVARHMKFVKHTHWCHMSINCFYLYILVVCSDNWLVSCVVSCIPNSNGNWLKVQHLLIANICHSQNPIGGSTLWRKLHLDLLCMWTTTKDDPFTSIYKVGVLNSGFGHMYLSGIWLGINLRMINKIE
jgi:hypothetical protein